MKKSILAAILVVVLMLGSLSGCKGTTTNPSANGSENLPSSGNNQTAHANEMVVGIPQDLDSLDPFQMGTAGTREVMFNVFEGLIKLNPDGSYKDAVASSHKVSEDGLKYTFTLRDGVAFHNGNAVTVDDVLYSLDTCVASTVNESVAAALSVATISAEGKDIVFNLIEYNPLNIFIGEVFSYL